MAMHQLLTCITTVGDSVVSYDNHMQATWCESDWPVGIQKQARKRARCVPDPFPPLRVGSGDEIYTSPVCVQTFLVFGPIQKIW